MAAAIDQDVIRLDVSVDHVLSVKFFNGQENLSSINARNVLTKLLLPTDDSAHVAAGTIVGHKVELVEGLESIAEFDNEPMVDTFLDLFFRHDVVHQARQRPLLHLL